MYKCLSIVLINDLEFWNNYSLDYNRLACIYAVDINLLFALLIAFRC